MAISFVKPTHELVYAIADDMRQADINEVWASNHYTPIEALMMGWDTSDYSVIVMVNDVPCVMLGLVIRDILAGTGVPWLLGTESALKYKRYFLKATPMVINDMLNVCPRLFNYVHVKNKVSINWLRRIGFTIGKPIEYGPDKELFCKFHLERV